MKRIAVFMIALCVSILPGLTAEAAVSDDLSLTIHTEYDGEAISGKQIIIYKVADAEEENGSLVYHSCAGDYEFTGMTAADNEEISAELAEKIADYGLAADTAFTDSEGNASFAIETAGLYLVIDESDQRYVFDPFLVSVPEAVKEGWNDTVVCAPKTGLIDTQTSGTAAAAGVQTGDRSEILFCAAAGTAALAAAVMVLIAAHRKENS